MSLRGGEWFSKRKDLAQKLVTWLCFAQPEVPDAILDFAYEIKDARCNTCLHWDHEFVGNYDSGNVAKCNHDKISGDHHPSNGCGMVEQTLVYCPTSKGSQEIFTRWNFGCHLWEKNNVSS